MESNCMPGIAQPEPTRALLRQRIQEVIACPSAEGLRSLFAKMRPKEIELGNALRRRYMAFHRSR
jgi:hypothetical protein